MPGGTDVSASIRAIAAHRPDIFGEGGDEEEAIRQAAEVAKSRAREAQVWDGHAASKDSITLQYQQTADLSEQIKALHRSKGLLATDPDGPQIGPSVPVASTSIAAEPTSLSHGASISSGPQPATLTIERNTSQNFQATGHLPPNFTSGAPSSVATPQDPPANIPSIPGLPARPNVHVPGEALPGPGPGSLSALEARNAPPPPPPSAPAASISRPADGEPEDERSAKRAKVSSGAGGHVYSEEEWLESHPEPVRIKVQLPDYAEKPAWGCKGQEVELEVPLTLLVGTIRDRIQVRLPSLSFLLASFFC